MRYNFSACRCRTRVWFGVSGTCVFALDSHSPSGTSSRHCGNALPFQKLLDGEHLVAGRGLIASSHTGFSARIAHEQVEVARRFADEVHAHLQS